MTTRGRNRLLRTLGVALTLAVIALDALDVLVPLERWMYDRRAALFTNFTPPPTDDLVHVDIDDNSLEAIGAWPWPRSTMADVIDELHRAGAKAVALDVLFAEAQAGPHDARLAESIRNAGNVLVPASFSFDPVAAPSAVRAAATESLAADLELTWEAIAARHRGLTEREFILARAEAVSRRVAEARGAGCRTPEDLHRRLLPRQEASGTSLARVVDAAWRKAEAEHALARFSRPAPTGLAEPPATAAGLSALVPDLVGAGAIGGYVDLHLPQDDGGVVRSVPLWVEYGGRLYPQMALSLACAALGVDPNAVTLRDDGMSIPRPGRPDLFVPLRSQRTEKLGRVGMFFDIPWFGGRDWRAMYDFPAHREPVRHLPVTLAWAVADGRRKVVQNNAEADEAMRFFAEYKVAAAQSFVAAVPPADEFAKRREAMDVTLAELDSLGGISAYADAKPDELSVDDQKYVASYNALRRAREQNADILRTLPRKQAELRQALAGRCVLVGWTATAATDSFPTPLHLECPGVVVHGAIFNAITTGEFWRKAPFWVDALITLGVGLLTTMVVGWVEPWKALALTGLLIGCYLTLNGATLFDYGNWLVGAAGPTVAGAAVWSGLTLTRFVGEAQEKNRITRRFGSYADANLVRFIIDHPELGHLAGRVEELTVVFTDLAGFTTLTEKLREKAVPILSDYMSRMVPVIQQRRGLVNKFLGDGIMFFYGAPMPNPDHAADAVATVMAMTDVLEQFNRELAAQGNPTVSMRAGISTGPMVVGDAGSELRSDYTVLGDAVNLGARLESANKAVGTTFLLSGRTVELLGGRFLVRPIGKLRVAGKTEGVMTFEPLAEAAAATESQRELARLTAAVFDAYAAARFAECLAAIDALEAAFGQTKLTNLYRDLANEYAATPPADFDGVIALKEK